MAESEGHGALTLWDLRSYTDDHDLPSPDPAPSATTSPAKPKKAASSVLLRRLLAGEEYHHDNFRSRTANHLWNDGPGVESVHKRANVKVECPDDVDEQYSEDETIEFKFETKPNVNLASGSNEHSHRKLDNDIDRHSGALETRFQDCQSFDEVDSQIDEDGWFLDEGEDENEPKNNTQCGPDCTTPTDGHDSFGASKQLMALALSVNTRNVFKRKNINVKSIQSGSANIEEQSRYVTNKKTRLVLDEIAASGSDIPAPGSNVRVTNAPESRFSDKSGLSGRNATSDPKVSKNSSIGHVGSLSLPAPAQSQERDSISSQSEGGRNIAMTSNSNTNLPDVVPNQSQRKLKSILDQAVNRAKTVRESLLALKAHCQDNSMAQNPNSGKKEEIKKKPRPSERARILQRRVPPKPMPPADALTVVALIPVTNLPSQGSNPTVPTDTPTVAPTQPTMENKDVVDEQSKKEQSTVGKSHMVLRSRDKNKLKKQNQTELNELSSQGDDDTQQHCKSIQGVQNKTQDPNSSSLVTIPNPLYPVFRRIAPKPKDYRPERSPPKKKVRRRRSKRPLHALPKTPQLVVPLFELVPELPATSISGNLPKVKSNAEGSSKPKPSSARRKQDPLSAQTKGEKWRQEESEVLIQESDSDHEEEQDPDLDPEEEQDQRLISLISDDEGDGWEVVEMEVNSDEERNQEDQGEFFW